MPLWGTIYGAYMNIVLHRAGLPKEAVAFMARLLQLMLDRQVAGYADAHGKWWADNILEFANAEPGGNYYFKSVTNDRYFYDQSSL